ncbi:glutathione S-transferase family protein [Phyllobacterium myrsinacearum]|uniref:Glutathione S-transferase n=1 Tax=Phyllobacterium myrsinacearum TaxID=28101 RepID=A0A839EQS7_9HYPH|nr:glutathione S-transferase [Phyllobacterium myrsinacearum]MBA8881152.1 glutathione S-transferase [Phyllobacterium myrsinacearum]
MLKIWGRRNSFNVQKVLWLAGELGLPHEHIPAGGSFGQIDSPEFLAMNPHGRVPVIDDAGTIVWQSHAILRYLAARFGKDQFWSDDAGKRSDDDRWMDWSQTALQPAFLTDIFWGFYRTPEARRDWAVINRGIERCSRHFQLLDRWLDGKNYMLGDRLGLADIAVGTHLYRYFNLDIERPHVPNVEGWYQRLQERAPYREHVMIPFDDLYGKLDF